MGDQASINSDTNVTRLTAKVQENPTRCRLGKSSGQYGSILRLVELSPCLHFFPGTPAQEIGLGPVYDLVAEHYN